MDESETRGAANTATPSKESGAPSHDETQGSSAPQEAGATAGAVTSDAVTSGAPTPAEQRPRKRVNGWIWAAIIFALLAGELYAYGHNGEVRVCVGRKAITDFTQLDKPRKGNIAAGYPFCVESLNLGMYSRSDDVAKEALEVACGRAATLLRGEKSECIRRDKDWIRRVDKHSIPPWDPRLYRRLFFIE